MRHQGTATGTSQKHQHPTENPFSLFLQNRQPLCQRATRSRCLGHIGTSVPNSSWLQQREIRGRPPRGEGGERGGAFGRGDLQQHYTHDYPSDQGNRGLTA